ncbi:MAG: hypothetical protein QHI48_12675 [Bacteroidota bacterium]|nr:hypothetical protein [Bacteroidota bacterium]
MLTCLAMCLSLSSCASHRCLYCRFSECPQEDAYLYSVELKSDVPDPCGGGTARSFVTPYPPAMLCAQGGTFLRIDLPCIGGGECRGTQAVTVTQEQVLRITRVSDTKTPPSPVIVDCRCVNCTSARDGLLGADKLELRAMGGYRGKQTAVFYPDAAGGRLYEPETFGFERGGTTFTVGVEAAPMWTLFRFNGTDAFHLGILTGVWPVDGSVFIPLSLHPRVTFNDRPDPYGCRCSAWYIFGDVGVTFDFTTRSPIARDRRVFAGAGVGYEFPLSRGTDFAIDIFARRVYLPLPAVECCPDIPPDQRNPVRISNVVGIRLGVTF